MKKEPRSMLDLSDPRQAGIAARLSQEEFAYLTTVRPDGRPHTIPVCFLWDGATILIFSQPNTVKCRNLRQNPHVSLALDSFGRDNTPVVVEGTAALVDDPDVAFMMPANVTKYSALAERIGETFEHLAQLYMQAIRITPTRIRQDQ
jgi:PPOX class probable F420-dependent enzyme